LKFRELCGLLDSLARFLLIETWFRCGNHRGCGGWPGFVQRAAAKVRI